MAPAPNNGKAGDGTAEKTSASKFLQKIGNHKPKFSRVGLKHSQMITADKNFKPKPSRKATESDLTLDEDITLT